MIKGSIIIDRRRAHQILEVSKGRGLEMTR